MGSKARKQRRISKHVLKAKEEQAKAKLSTENSDLPVPPHEQKKKQIAAPKQSKKHTKDPLKAAAYLSSWKHREAGSAWKFNKNNQSWLIRHMYESELVQKATFETLLSYLAGMHNKDRVIEDAERRALRYKEFQSTAEAKKGDVEVDEKEGGDDEKTSEPVIIPSDEDDETRWKRLNAHDKRKEYKRARKVLETLQSVEIGGASVSENA